MPPSSHGLFETTFSAMKLLLDQFPIIAFFVAYFVPGDWVHALLSHLLAADQAQAATEFLYPPGSSRSIFFATAVAIPASLLQVILHRRLFGRFDKTQLITLALLLVLGGSTLLLHDKRYIMWKPTAVYWLFALVFLGSQFIGDRPIAERMMGHIMDAPRRIWRQLNAGWVVFFTLLGALNLYVARNFDESTWVKFKMFGVLGLLVVFTAAQTFYLSAYGEMKEEHKD